MKFKTDQTAQKLRGGYYTPQNLADYVTRWVLAGNPESIIEPSCGDGSFLSALSNNRASKDLKINAFELFDTEVEKSRRKCEEFGFKNATITEGDFLSWANKNLNSAEQQVSGILGNPPFIRYQFLEKEFQLQTELVFKQLNLKFTKHTNAWVPFVLSCIKLLKAGGRFGMVIPSEIIHVMHAQSLRTFLGEQCSKLVVIDPQEIWFENTLQGAVILLAQKKAEITDHSYGVGIKHVKGFEFLNINPEILFDETIGINGQTVAGKWTKAILSPTELDLITRTMENSHVYKFTEVADVDVGIVTGANKFFLVDNETVEKYDLQKFSKPMFGKSQHCKGIIYNQQQHKQNEENKYPTNFIYLEDDFSDLPKSVQEYIKLGESEELHKRYKCRIRKPWYKVPSVYSRNLGMLKRSHDTPRLIFNQLEALTTDTAYRVTAKNTDPAKLAFCFINPLTAIFAELEGRYYGGGVLELVPSEIENLYIPVPDKLDFNIQELDESIRAGGMSETLREQGYKILSPLGLSHEEIDSLVTIWERLKNRRQRNDH